MIFADECFLGDVREAALVRVVEDPSRAHTEQGGIFERYMTERSTRDILRDLPTPTSLPAWCRLKGPIFYR